MNEQESERLSALVDGELARAQAVRAVDAALGLALFAFVTTVLLGYFLGKGEFPHE